jgi:hypothetical protein
MCIPYRRTERAQKLSEREELPQDGMVGIMRGLPLALALWAALIVLAAWHWL